MPIFIIISTLFIGILIYRLFVSPQKRFDQIASTPFPENWRKILTERVFYYTKLDDKEKLRFEKEIQIFLGTTRISPVEVEIDEALRILVAASAVIPVFGFKKFRLCTNIHEVLIYPNAFDENYSFGEGNAIGQVGNMYMSGVMILVKPYLIKSFEFSQDGDNVGIHEFAHIFDKMDGYIDGIPAGLPAAMVQPWKDVMHREIEAINAGKSDINSYGGTNEAEFFAVASEYFFERPEKLQEKHPELYQLLQKIYHQNTISLFKNSVRRVMRKISIRKPGVNAPCPCGSGKKYKKCCRG